MQTEIITITTKQHSCDRASKYPFLLFSWILAVCFKSAKRPAWVLFFCPTLLGSRQVAMVETAQSTFVVQKSEAYQFFIESSIFVPCNPGNNPLINVCVF